MHIKDYITFIYKLINKHTTAELLNVVTYIRFQTNSHTNTDTIKDITDKLCFNWQRQKVASVRIELATTFLWHHITDIINYTPTIDNRICIYPDALSANFYTEISDPQKQCTSRWCQPWVIHNPGTLTHSAWSESTTSSWYRDHRVLSYLMFWGSDIDFDTKRSNVYRLWGYISR